MLLLHSKLILQVLQVLLALAHYGRCQELHFSSENVGNSELRQIGASTYSFGTVRGQTRVGTWPLLHVFRLLGLLFAVQVAVNRLAAGSEWRPRLYQTLKLL